MSWKDRLRRSRTAEAAATEVAEGAPAGAEPTDAPALRAVPTGGEHDALVRELGERLAALSEGKLRADEIDPKGHLFDYGYIDSLSAVSFLAQLEQEYDTRVEDVELIDRLSTLDAIATRIEQSR